LNNLVTGITPGENTMPLSGDLYLSGVNGGGRDDEEEENEND
jgi:hypothetical protein